MFGLATKKDLDKIKREVGYTYDYGDHLTLDKHTIVSRVRLLEDNASSPHYIGVKIPKHIPELVTEYAYPLHENLSLQKFVTMLCDHLKLVYTPQSCTSPKLTRGEK